MNSELYTATSGLLVEQRRLELIANNLANAATNGFRPARTFSAEYRGLSGSAGSGGRVGNTGVALAGTWETPGPGPVFETGAALDVALASGDLLGIETPAGRRYTRAGSLRVTATGELTDAAGRPVLGAEGKAIAGLGQGAAVEADGRIVQSGSEVARLLVVRDPARVLSHEGEALLTAGGRDAELEPVAAPALRPGWLEGSSTDAIGELVRLVEAQRAFESYQKLISLSMNEVNRRAVNDIAG